MVLLIAPFYYDVYSLKTYMVESSCKSNCIWCWTIFFFFIPTTAWQFLDEQWKKQCDVGVQIAKQNMIFPFINKSSIYIFHNITGKGDVLDINVNSEHGFCKSTMNYNNLNNSMSLAMCESLNLQKHFIWNFRWIAF